MRKKDVLGYMIILSLLVLVSGAFYARSAILGSRPQLDEDTLCPIGKELLAHTVLLVDRTDPLTKEQTTRLFDLIRRIRRGLTEYEEFSIFLITENQISIAEPYFSLCAPPQGDQASPWHQNPRKIRQAYEQKFGEPLKSKVEDLQKGTVAPASPIMSTIGAVMRRADMSNKVARRRLLIVSDFLENTEGFTQYTGNGTTFESFKRTPNYSASQRTRLDGVSVELLYVHRERDAAFQRAGHRRFWEQWFEDRGARDIVWQDW